MSWEKKVTSETDPTKTYTVSFKDNIFSCTCMAWRNQCAPINLRTCKHLIKLLGSDVEKQRAPESFAGLTSIFPCANKRSTQKIGETWEKPMLFHTLQKENIVSWYYSLKMNGAFGRWQNGQLYTKNGRLLHPPVEITQHLPREATLDGEIYARHNRSHVRKALSDIWEKDVKFVVFDLVEHKVTFEDRWHKLRQLHKKYGFDLVPQYQITSEKEATRIFHKISRSDEEGLVLRHSSSFYESGIRSKTTLKWKPQKDSSGVVKSIQPKKTGYTMKVLENNTEILFTLYIPNKQMKKHPIHIGDQIKFIYFGRDEKNQPELPKLYSLDAR